MTTYKLATHYTDITEISELKKCLCQCGTKTLTQKGALASEFIYGRPLGLTKQVLGVLCQRYSKHQLVACGKRRVYQRFPWNLINLALVLSAAESHHILPPLLKKERPTINISAASLHLSFYYEHYDCWFMSIKCLSESSFTSKHYTYHTHTQKNTGTDTKPKPI